MAVSSKTAVTPIPMPSAVSTLRNLCATMDWPTSHTKSRCRIPLPLHERVDGVESRRAARWQNAEHEAARHRDADGGGRGPGRRSEVEHRKQNPHEPNAGGTE